MKKYQAHSLIEMIAAVTTIGIVSAVSLDDALDLSNYEDQIASLKVRSLMQAGVNQYHFKWQLKGSKDHARGIDSGEEHWNGTRKFLYFNKRGYLTGSPACKTKFGDCRCIWGLLTSKEPGDPLFLADDNSGIGRQCYNEKGGYANATPCSFWVMPESTSNQCVYRSMQGEGNYIITYNMQRGTVKAKEVD